ncbi:MAG: PIN domain-containing protein, partial [Candidatus Hydrothermarchaeota archaeon]|nr:PIN domain-containing protein [Candidatus Hydrothermarchaeota archaeon]
IAVANDKDRWHAKAKEVAKTLLEEKIVTELILAESVTSIGALSGGKAGIKVYNYIIEACEVAFVDRKLFDRAAETYLKYDGTLSLTDAVSIEVMSEKGIKEIVSFDSDFDKVRGIVRIGK